MKRFLSLTGFTLLEILIVVVIIGILAGLAIPKFNKTIETAKGKEAYVTLETLRTAERMYYLDNDSYTNIVGVGSSFSQLVPDYLPENPNRNYPNGNWGYGYWTSGSLPRLVARRLGGSYGTPSYAYVGMDMNGNMLNATNGWPTYYWPWPPD